MAKKVSKQEENEYFGIFNSNDLCNDDVVNDIKADIAEANDMDIDEVSYEDISETFWNSLDDEKMNLNKELDGKYIVAFADLGLWNGRFTAGRKMGTNISSIFNFYDYYDYEWYADLYDVRCNLYHHDGTNRVIFRCVNTEGEAESILNLARRGELTEEYFFNHTTSLRPYVAKVYGWKNYHHSKKREERKLKRA